MIYKQFHDIKLSALGLGCMRLPHKPDRYEEIDVPEVKKMVAYAIEHGINYFDTAWGYHNGNSESAMGEVLADYPRESFYLASKFPGYDVANMVKAREIFEEQLRKCRVDYFDFYLFHNVNENNIDAFLDPKYGIRDFLAEQKKAGRIKHLGFSAHGQMPVLKRFLEAYGKDLEFCQLQVNFLDWTYQNAKEKIDLITEYHLPLWVMEPLRGGRLVTLDPEYETKLKALRPNETIPAWSFRFLQTLPQTGMILSGMSNMEQLKANVETFETNRPLNSAELQTLLGIADDMLAKNVLPCTSCRYCTEYCPQKLNIPRIIQILNNHAFSGNPAISPNTLKDTAEEQWPTACLHCRSCEAVCPQQIKISDAMAEFATRLSK